MWVNGYEYDRNEGRETIENLQKILGETTSVDSILANPEVLNENYLPPKLLFRENEMNEIMTLCGRFLKGDNPKSILIHGPAGTGKTHAARLIQISYNEYAEIHNLDTRAIYINARDHTYYQVLVSLLDELNVQFPRRGLGVTEATEKLVETLRTTDYKYLIIIDEVDKIRSYDQKKWSELIDSLFYRFSRLDELTMKDNVLFVAISNRGDIVRHLKYHTRSKFIPHLIYFREYNQDELKAILADRVRRAFKPGSVEEDAIVFLSAMIIKEGRDLRWGMKVLKEAAHLAGDKLTPKHIERAMIQVDKDMLIDAINGFNIDALVALWSIAYLTKKGKIPTTGAVYKTYGRIMRNLNLNPKSMRHIMHYIMPRIEETGIISSQIKFFGFKRGRALTFHLEEQADTIMRITSDVILAKTGKKIILSDAELEEISKEQEDEGLKLLEELEKNFTRM